MPDNSSGFFLGGLKDTEIAFFKKYSGNIDCASSRSSGAVQTLSRNQYIALYLLLHKVSRLMVAHPLGSGKTVTMWMMLDRFFGADVAKFVLVPNRAVKKNFYAMLGHMKGLKYHDHVAREIGRPNSPWDSRSVADLLQRKKRPILRGTDTDQSSPRGVLVVLTFSQAGSRSKAFWQSRFMRYATQGATRGATTAGEDSFEDPFEDPFSRSLVLVDEAHILVDPGLSTTRYTHRQVVNIERLRDRLTEPHDPKFFKMALFTATPVVNDASDLATLKRIMTSDGRAEPASCAISCFMNSESSLYPLTVPRSDAIPYVVRVPLRGANLDAYRTNIRKARARLQKSKASLRKKETARPSSAFEHMFTASTRTMKRHAERNARDNARGNALTGNTFIRSAFPRALHAERATKLFAIARWITNMRAEEAAKVVVFLDPRHGPLVLEKILRDLGSTKPRPGYLAGEDGDARKIADFNRAASGLVILNARQYSESISLRGVTAIILGDISYKQESARWSNIKQRIARAVRICSHADHGRDQGPAAVKIFLFVAQYRGGDDDDDEAEGGKISTSDERLLARITEDRETIEGLLRGLKNEAIDRDMYPPQSRESGTDAPAQGPRSTTLTNDFFLEPRDLAAIKVLRRNVRAANFAGGEDGKAFAVCAPAAVPGGEMPAVEVGLRIRNVKTTYDPSLGPRDWAGMSKRYKALIVEYDTASNAYTIFRNGAPTDVRALLENLGSRKPRPVLCFDASTGHYLHPMIPETSIFTAQRSMGRYGLRAAPKKTSRYDPRS